MIFAWSALVVAGLALVLAAAVRSQFLVVLHSRRYGLLLLERGAGGRYRIFAPHGLPLVLLRYLALGGSGLLSAARRAASGVHAHGHRTLGAKA